MALCKDSMLLLQHVLPRFWPGLCFPRCFCCRSSCQAVQPNVVIILADDLGWGDVGYHGSEISTPHHGSGWRQGASSWIASTRNPACSPNAGRRC